MNRTVIWRDDDHAWWQWRCGWSACPRGGGGRTRREVQQRVDDHHREHAQFGFRPCGGREKGG